MVAMVDEAHHLASVDVAGVRRNVNVGLLIDEGIAPGDWVLITWVSPWRRSTRRRPLGPWRGSSCSVRPTRTRSGRWPTPGSPEARGRGLEASKGKAGEERGEDRREATWVHSSGSSWATSWGRAGREGFEELRRAWDTIVRSQEVRDMVSGGMAMGKDLLQQGRGLLAERIAPQGPGQLRRVA